MSWRYGGCTHGFFSLWYSLGMLVVNLWIGIVLQVGIQSYTFFKIYDRHKNHESPFWMIDRKLKLINSHDKQKYRIYRWYCSTYRTRPTRCHSQINKIIKMLGHFCTKNPERETQDLLTSSLPGRGQVQWCTYREDKNARKAGDLKEEQVGSTK